MVLRDLKGLERYSFLKHGRVEVVPQACLINSYGEKASEELVMKVLEREYVLENKTEKEIRQEVQFCLRQMEGPQPFNR